MPQVSRRPIPKETENQIFESLFVLIGLLNYREAQGFLSDLLTKTEKVMLAKRLAIAILLASGKSYSEIKAILNVTQSTVVAVAKTLELSQGYKGAIDKLKRSQKWEGFWQALERIHYRNIRPKAAFLPDDEIKSRLKQTKRTLV